MTELAVRRNAPLSFAPTSFEELVKFAEIAARTDIVPKDYIGKPGNIIIAVQMGAEVGFSPTQSLQSIAVIKGRATIWGDGLLGLVRASGLCEYVKEWIEGEQGVDEKGETNIKLDTRVAFCETKRKGEPDPVIRSFSVQDARKANLWGKDQSPWVTYPMRQMGMRARSWVLRDVYADVIRGLSVAEEVQDYDEPTNVTPAPDAPPSTSSRADTVRAALALAQRTAASSAKPDPEPAATVVEGVVEAPLPDVGRMLAEQIGETINEEAMLVGMSPAELKELIPIATEGKRAGRSNAHAIIRAIRKWGADKAAAAEVQQNSGESTEPATQATPAQEPPAPIDYAAHKCPIHGTPTSECEDESCREKIATYLAMAGQPSLLDGTPA